MSESYQGEETVRQESSSLLKVWQFWMLRVHGSEAAGCAGAGQSGRSGSLAEMVG